MRSVLSPPSSRHASYAIAWISLVPAISFATDDAAPKRLDIGARAPTFAFTDSRWLPRTLDDFGEKSAFVIVFTTLDCPVAQRALPRLAEMEKAYRPRGVQFLEIDVGAQDSMIEVAARAIEQGIEFPVSRDYDGAAVRALSATRTPEVVVLDKDMNLAYRGRIDARERLSGTIPGDAREDLREALDDVLAARTVRVAETVVDGCKITLPDRSGAASGASAPTYAEDIAPILAHHCQACHAPGKAAPFVLATYEQAASRSEMIAEVVEQGRMPPWFASHAHGHFENHRGLDAREIDVISRWVRAGVPRGDLSKLATPASVAIAPAWRIGEPDLVVSMLTKVKIPATGYVPYKYIVLPHVFGEDTWVQAVEIRPSNKRVVHHANLGYYQFGGDVKSQNFITGEVPGGDPMDLDPGIALKIPAGSVLGLQVHYVTTGKEEEDRISVGLRFPRVPVQKRIQHKEIADFRFEIPPFAPAFPVRSERAFEVDAVGIGMYVHMHLRGRDMRFRATYPDRRDETLLFVPNYSFDWQMAYRWEKGAQEFPKGTKVECLAHFDNSKFNPFNPDATKAVRFGQETFDEMMYGFLFYVAKDEALNLHVDPATGHELGR